MLFNGLKTTPFIPSRGIRQGDPISPYFFVLCMERLAHLIQKEVTNGAWKPVVLSRGGPPISHLFFADDLLLFGEASSEQIGVMRSCLENFCSTSGQKVSLEKSRLLVSRNVHHARASQLSREVCISLTSDLGKYLGVPLLH